MKMAVKNIFTRIPKHISEELFENIITGENLRIERIISKGHRTADNQWYDQDEHEWVMLLKGQAKLEFADHSSMHLEAGSHINIPAHTRHRVAWTQPDTETVWLAVYYQ